LIDHGVPGALQSNHFLVARFAGHVLQILDDWAHPSVDFGYGQAFGVSHAWLLQMDMSD